MGYLAFFILAVTAFVFGLNWRFKSGPAMNMPDVGFGRTTWTYYLDLYFAPWNRYQPYLVGVVLGYILHHTRGKAVKVDPMVNMVLWQVSFLAAFAVVYGLHDLRSGGKTTLFMATAYNAFQRLAWAFSLAWVIFSCTKGYGGPVNDFLSWSAFGPLSRLTYCCYLVHMEVLPMFALSVLTYPNDISLLNVVMYFIGGLTISLCAAVVLVLAFEIPFTRVEKILVDRLLGIVMGSAKEKQPAAQASSPTVTDSKMSDALSKSEDSIGKEDIESLKTQDSGQGSDQSQKSSE